MQSQEEAILVSGQQEKTTGICKKNMKIGHLMIGAKLFGLTKVTLR